MGFEFVKDFMESIFHEEMWIFEIIFCMVAPSFLFTFLLSKEIFNSVELIRLLLLCILSNSVLFYVFIAFQSLYSNESVSDIKERINALHELDREMLKSENEFHLLEHEINLSGKSTCKKVIRNKRNASMLSKTMEISRVRQEQVKQNLEKIKKKYMISIIERVFKRTMFICIIILILILHKYINDVNMGKLFYTLIVLLAISLIVFLDSINK